MTHLTTESDQQDAAAHHARSADFAAAVSGKKIGGSARDGIARGAGLLLMILGAVGGFVAYNLSLSQDDFRDIASSQVLAIAFLGVAVLGAGLYVAGAVAAVLRLWLLRQLIDSQDRTQQLVDALRP